MRYNKDECEKLIDESPLFHLDRETEPSAYRREVLKMVEYLYSYLMALNAGKYEEYAVEIVDTAKRCIENYEPDQGRFINYFNSSWKQSYGHIVGRELVKNTFAGVHFSEDDARNYRKYMKLAQSMGADIDSDSFKKMVSDAMGISVEAVEDLQHMAESKPVSCTYVNEEGEEFSLIDQLDGGIYVESAITENDNAIAFMDLIKIVFEKLQERQKPMMAKLLTSKLALLTTENEVLSDYLHSMPYFDEEIFVECIHIGESVQAKEISSRLGVNEASTSRSWKNFKDKLTEGMKERKN